MRIVCAVFTLAVAALAADQAAFTVWRDSDLKAKEKELAGKSTRQRMASETLATYGNHLTMLAHRKASGEPEVHERMADFFVVETGEATLLVGGKVIGGKNVAPGEIRGGRIEGGEKQTLAVGDVVHIVAGIPHQLLLDPGKEFTYFVIKVEKP